MRYVVLLFLVIVLSGSWLMASSASRYPSEALVGVWLHDGQDLVLRADGTWSSNSAQEQHYGNWHVADGKLIQTDWSGSGVFVVIWTIVAADNETLSLRVFETGRGQLKRYDTRRTYKRMPDFPRDPGPNRAIQPTASRRTDLTFDD